MAASAMWAWLGAHPGPPGLKCAQACLTTSIRNATTAAIAITATMALTMTSSRSVLFTGSPSPAPLFAEVVGGTALMD